MQIGYEVYTFHRYHYFAVKRPAAVRRHMRRNVLLVWYIPPPIFNPGYTYATKMLMYSGIVIRCDTGEGIY